MSRRDSQSSEQPACRTLQAFSVRRTVSDLLTDCACAVSIAVSIAQGHPELQDPARLASSSSCGRHTRGWGPQLAAFCLARHHPRLRRTTGCGTVLLQFEKLLGVAVKKLRLVTANEAACSCIVSVLPMQCPIPRMKAFPRHGDLFPPQFQLDIDLVSVLPSLAGTMAERRQQDKQDSPVPDIGELNVQETKPDPPCDSMATAEAYRYAHSPGSSGAFESLQANSRLEFSCRAKMSEENKQLQDDVRKSLRSNFGGIGKGPDGKWRRNNDGAEVRVGFVVH